MKAVHNDVTLLQGLARSDRQAIEIIYKENFGLIQSLVVKNNGTADDAKDLFQEAMVILYEKVCAGNFELQVLLKTYLYAVCRRLWLKKLGQQNRFVIVDNHENQIEVEDDLSTQQQKADELVMMEKALNGLGEPCKSLLQAFYLKKRSMHEIAQDFGYTNPENAKNQKYKCLMRLKKIFFSQYKKEL